MSATQLLAVCLREAACRDADLLAALVAGLSPESSFHRFMAGVGVPNPALVRGLLRAEPDRGALLAVRTRGAGDAVRAGVTAVRAKGNGDVVRAGGDGEEAVGHACWAVLPNGAADIGVLVADAHQRRGIGTALFVAAASVARSAGADAVHLDVHPDNRRLVAALRRRLGSGPFAWNSGLLSVDAPMSAVLPSAAAA